MKRRAGRFVGTLVGAMLGVVLGASVALADPELKTSASSQRVEAHEPFTVQLSALVGPGESMPSDPQLRPPVGATIIGGPSIGTSMVVINGNARVGIQASWTLVSNAPGRAKIPAPSVLWQGKRFSGKAFEVEIVPNSGKPRQSNNPFLLPGGPGFGFGQLFGGLDPFGDDDQDEDAPKLDENLELRTAPDPNVFVYARADRTQAVIGEQVTVSFYLYQRVNVDFNDRRDPTAADFLRWSMLSNPGAEPILHAKAGGKLCVVRLIERLALFPTRTGDLHIGPMQLWLTARQIGRHALRESEDVVIHVTEPPRQGRPAGYALGDVGRFSLSATVEPRRINEGGSVAVTVRVNGNGNFPQSLAVPERTGVEWLDPEKRESIAPQAGVIAGYRSFGYVVRIKEAGTVDLGKIALPHWDPASKKYDVASAELGKIEVLPAPLAPLATATANPSTKDDPSAQKNADPFQAMPAPRASLSAYSPAAAPLFDGARLYLALAAPPLAYGFFAAAVAGARRLRARRAEGATSPSRLTAVALDEADRARASNDSKAVCAAVERAIHHAVEGGTGLKSRGILLADLRDELVEAGLSEELADETRAMLDEASALRFDPSASPTSLEDLVRRGRTLTRELLAQEGRSA